MKTINNNIEEPYCSHEVSKLLRDKGFDVFCNDTYTEYLQDTEYNKKGLVFERGGIVKGRNSTHAPLNSEYYEKVSARTQGVALEWLRVNYNLHFEIIWDNYRRTYWFVCITHIGNVEIETIDLPRKQCFTPKDAIDAAFVYTLN